MGLIQRKHNIKTYQKGHCGSEIPVYLCQQGASQFGEPPQGAGITIKHIDVEHLLEAKDIQE